MIYVDTHKVEDHRFRVNSCIVKIGKICIYIISKYINYGT